MGKGKHTVGLEDRPLRQGDMSMHPIGWGPCPITTHATKYHKELDFLSNSSRVESKKII